MHDRLFLGLGEAGKGRDLQERLQRLQRATVLKVSVGRYPRVCRWSRLHSALCSKKDEDDGRPPRVQRAGQKDRQIAWHGGIP